MTHQDDMQDRGLIDLGDASVETKGSPDGNPSDGLANIPNGLSNE